MLVKKVTFALAFIGISCILLQLLYTFLVPITPERLRLPIKIWPQGYNITLRPHMLASDSEKRFTFDGNVEITVLARRTTNRVVVHSKNLTYSVAQIWQVGQCYDKYNLMPLVYLRESEQLIFKSPLMLNQTHMYVLRFIYAGNLNNPERNGFYMDSYLDKYGNERFFAATQLTPHYARRVFPCFDEPQFKANFKLKIIRHKVFKSFSNMEKEQIIQCNKYIKDIFITTPTMSPHLLSILLIQHEYYLSKSFGLVIDREYYNQSQYTLEVAPKMLHRLEEYFVYPYKKMGFKRLYLAAVPNYKADGLVASWGLIMFNDNKLYIDPDNTYQVLQTKQLLVKTLARELTHQWFGNLITCEWWKYLWLQEGFARYFEYYNGFVDKIHNFQLENQFVVNHMQPIMETDSFIGASPLVDYKNYRTSDLSNIFNAFVYDKGAAFIRMVRHILGEVQFRDSLVVFLKMNEYRTSTPNDLLNVWYDYFPEQFKAAAEPFFKSFTEQPGYPLVTVIIKDRNATQTVISFTQKRFLLPEQTVYNYTEMQLRYTTPISYTTDVVCDFEATQPRLFINPCYSTTLVLDGSINWIILNIQQSGYYRVNYDKKIWREIAKALWSENWGDIPPLNRAQIVDDLFYLARAKLVSYKMAKRVWSYLAIETHYLPWTAAFRGFKHIAKKLGTDINKFANYTTSLLELAYIHVGFEPNQYDTGLTVQHRANVLEWACKYGYPYCLERVRNYFDNRVTKPIPMDLRGLVYCNVLRTGDHTDYEIITSLLKNATNELEKKIIFESMACVRDLELVERHFWRITESNLLLQQQIEAIKDLYEQNSENIMPVFNLLTKNFAKLENNFRSPSKLACLLSNLSTFFTTTEEMIQLENFIDENKSTYEVRSILIAAHKKLSTDLKGIN